MRQLILGLPFFVHSLPILAISLPSLAELLGDCRLTPGVALVDQHYNLYRQDPITSYESRVPLLSSRKLAGLADRSGRVWILGRTTIEECFHSAVHFSLEFPLVLELNAVDLLSEQIFPYTLNARAYPYVQWEFRPESLDRYRDLGLVNAMTPVSAVVYGDQRRREVGSPLLN